MQIKLARPLVNTFCQTQQIYVWLYSRKVVCTAISDHAANSLQALVRYASRASSPSFVATFACPQSLQQRSIDSSKGAVLLPPVTVAIDFVKCGSACNKRAIDSALLPVTTRSRSRNSSFNYCIVNCCVFPSCPDAILTKRCTHGPKTKYSTKIRHKTCAINVSRIVYTKCCHDIRQRRKFVKCLSK